MRWIERKLIKVANRWGVNEAMASKPSKRQRKTLKETCLTESTLHIWFEIGGEKIPSRYIEKQPKPEQKNKNMGIRIWRSERGDLDTYREPEHKNSV